MSDAKSPFEAFEYPVMNPALASKDHHFERIEELYRERWGTIHPDVIADLQDPEADYWALVMLLLQMDGDHRIDEDVLGFCTVDFLTPEEAEAVFYPASIDWTGDDWEGARGVLHIQMCAVDEEHEGNGHGTTLIRQACQLAARERFVTDIDPDWVAAVCWHRDDHRDARPLVEQLGFAETVTVENYYWEQETTRTTCPDCESICECDATVYTTQLEAFQ